MNKHPTSGQHWDTLVTWLLVVLLGVPLIWVAWVAALGALDWAAWRSLWASSQVWGALGLTLLTGLAASGLACALAAWLLSRYFPGPGWPGLVRRLSPLLAVPHAAFAIGLAFLISPSGWLLRLSSPWATGLQAPPPWQTTQDPWGVGLVLVLVAKEVPFLLWTAATQLQRADVAKTWRQELQVARSLGYGRHTAWWRVIWPQLWPRMRWPMLAVLAYSLTAAWLLAGTVALASTAVWHLPRWGRWRAAWTRGDRGQPVAVGQRHGRLALGALLAAYGGVMLALAVGSVSGYWPFPKVLPENFTWGAWRSVWASASTVGTTLSLAGASGLTALVWSVAWLECAPAVWRNALRRFIYLPLVLPPVLWVIGLHGLTLSWGMDASWSGLWLAHTLAILPYVLIALTPAYTGFDPRLRQVCASLGHGRAMFLWRVKWPLLRAALTSALAIGMAVSVAQYLPTLFIGAGRFATVTTEAVTLASGAQRSLTAAYAWLQWLLPVAAFALAAWLGQARKYQK
jgi:putative thiamine transport system permease protein